MANWNLPAITSGYLDFVTELNDKFVDAGTIGYGAPTNLPEHAIRFNRTINIFEEWVAGAWVSKIIGIAGGGTGATDPAAIRINLGLGSMSTQNSNAVAITGGSISGVAYNANDITSGIVALARGGTGNSLALGAPGHILMSLNGAVSFDPGINIAQLNANNLAVGTVPLARLSGVGFTNSDNGWIGNNDFQGAVLLRGTGINSPTVYSNSPILNFYNSAGAVNEHYFRIALSGRNFYVQSLDDSYTGSVTYAIFNPFGFIVGNNGELPIYAVGTNLTALNGSNISTGIVAPSRLGTGTPNAGNFLRGDGTWADIPAGAVIPSGLIAMFATGCPTGWTRVAGLDNRFPLGSSSFGTTGGNVTHLHAVSGNTNSAGVHRHHVNSTGSASGTLTGRTDEETNQTPIDVNRTGPTAMFFLPHSHALNVSINIPANVSGDTDDSPSHTHSFAIDTQQGGDYPPYMTVVYCQKN